MDKGTFLNNRPITVGLKLMGPRF